MIRANRRNRSSLRPVAAQTRQVRPRLRREGDAWVRIGALGQFRSVVSFVEPEGEDDDFDFGFEIGLDAEKAADYDGGPYRLGGNQGESDGFGIALGPRKTGRALDALTGLFGVRNLGVLPDNFYLKIRALQQEGRANIRSRPQIATLNGHQASLVAGGSATEDHDPGPIAEPVRIMTRSTMRLITRAVSSTGSARPRWLSPVVRCTTEPPIWYMPASKLTRVRVLAFSKIIASVRSTSGVYFS